MDGAVFVIPAAHGPAPPGSRRFEPSKWGFLATEVETGISLKILSGPPSSKYAYCASAPASVPAPGQTMLQPTTWSNLAPKRDARFFKLHRELVLPRHSGPPQQFLDADKGRPPKSCCPRYGNCCSGRGPPLRGVQSHHSNLPEKFHVVPTRPRDSPATRPSRPPAGTTCSLSPSLPTLHAVPFKPRHADLHHLHFPSLPAMRASTGVF